MAQGRMVLFSATTARKNVGLNHIKEAHIIQAQCFLCYCCQNKVILVNQIKEEHTIETQYQ